MRECQSLKKELSEEKIMDCMNCGQKRSFNRGIYYVDMTNDKLLKLSEVCKAPENKFYYLFQKQLCKYKYVFPTFSNLSTVI